MKEWTKETVTMIVTYTSMTNVPISTTIFGEKVSRYSQRKKKKKIKQNRRHVCHTYLNQIWESTKAKVAQNSNVVIGNLLIQNPVSDKPNEYSK